MQLFMYVCVCVHTGLWMQVEMISRAHDCYTLACSVDGIAEVLKAAREITHILHKGRHYKLMVSS